MDKANMRRPNQGSYHGGASRDVGDFDSMEGGGKETNKVIYT